LLEAESVTVSGTQVAGVETTRRSIAAAEPASFSTDDVPLDLAVLRAVAGQVSREAPAASCPAAEHRGGLLTMTPDRSNEVFNLR
jgi:hypothetical protein